jgi:hypothetical protein
MKIKVEQNGNIKTIRINDHVKIEDIKTISDEFESLSDVKEIHVDISEMDYGCSAFLGLIISVKKKYPDVDIKIFNPNDLLLELLSIQEFKRYFSIVTTQ